MKLVADTNILFSFFRENPVRFIIINSKSFGIELFTSEYNIDELRKNKSDLFKYSGLNSEQIGSVIDELNKHISSVSPNEYKQFEQEAKQVSPHDKDAPVFALALKIKADVWSNEPRLKKQSVVKVYSTEDLRKLIGF